MTTALPPYPYFKGIGFNPAYFNSSYITQDQANKLYLLKTYSDTATAKEAFSAGIVASSISTNNGNLIMGTGQITCGNITSTSGGFGSGTITANGYALNGTAPTITKSSLGYYVNYAYTTANISTNQTYYLYSPLINSTTTADNYLYAGNYLVHINSSVFDKNTPTGGTSNSTLGVCYGTTTSATAIPTNAQYGTLCPTTAVYSYSMLGINSINIGNGLSCGFNLPTDGYVNIQLKIIMTNPTNFGSFCYNVNGCITRIA